MPRKEATREPATGGRTTTQRLVAVLFVGMVCSGCTRWVPIRADQLPKLNGTDGPSATGGTVVGADGVSPVLVVSDGPERVVLDPDGRTVRVEGEPNVAIVDNAGTRTVFERPVVSSLNDAGILRVAAQNRPETEFDLGNLSHVEVQQPNPAAVGLAVAGVIVGAVVLGIVAATAGD